MSVDHFNQNGNVKSISHIDADVNVGNENDDNEQKAIQSIAETAANEKMSLEKSDIELAVRQSKTTVEKKDVIAVKEKSDDENDEKDDKFYLFRYPKHKRIWKQAFWIIIWPVELIFFLTIPNCEQKRFKNLFPLTFLMCIVWIGSLSYLVAWMITIVGEFFFACLLVDMRIFHRIYIVHITIKLNGLKIEFSLESISVGDTLNIPDSVMGITFLAAGTSVPEAVSSVIVAKQGIFHIHN